jgi:hypothetical protein
MAVSLAPWELSQCDTTCEPRLKLNAQQPLVQQISQRDRASRFTVVPCGAKGETGCGLPNRAAAYDFSLSIGELRLEYSAN